MSRRALFIFLGVIAFFIVLGVGALAGGTLAYLALQARPIRAMAALQTNPDREAGILVAGVAEDSPAAEAGLVRGDILLEVNGEAVDDLRDLSSFLDGLESGGTVELTVLHGDEQRTLSATIDEPSDSLFLGIQSCGVLPQGEIFFRGELMKGALITAVVEGSPAAEAGLENGDRILAVDGKEVGPEDSLADLIAADNPGDTVTLQIDKPVEGELEVTVRLGTHPDDAERAYLGVSFLPGLEGLGSVIIPSEPFGVLPFDKGFRNLPELPEGISQAAVIWEIAPDSPAEEAGLQEKDLIISVDGGPVESHQALRQAVESRKPGDQITLEVIRSGEEEPRTVEVTLGKDPDEPGKAYLGVQAFVFINVDSNEQGRPSFDFDFNFPFLDKLRDRLMPGKEL